MVPSIHLHGVLLGVNLSIWLGLHGNDLVLDGTISLLPFFFSSLSSILISSTQMKSTIPLSSLMETIHLQTMEPWNASKRRTFILPFSLSLFFFRLIICTEGEHSLQSLRLVIVKLTFKHLVVLQMRSHIQNCKTLSTCS